MIFFKNIDETDDEDDDVFPLDDDLDEEIDEDDENIDDEELDEDEDDEKEENAAEDLGELEKIEAKLEKGEDVAISTLESTVLPKSKVVYICPRCKKIYLNKKWVKDNITDIYTVRTELAYCGKCESKAYDVFVGSVEIYDKNLAERKEAFSDLVHQVERELEDTVPFEKILNITEKKGILFIFVNTTRLTMEIGKRLRQEFGGGIQYEWFERNQYLRVKWFDEVDNRNYFKERIRALKDRRFGMFAFEEEE
jgi:hypothetical protein